MSEISRSAELLSLPELLKFAGEKKLDYRASGVQITASVKSDESAHELARLGHRRFLLALDECTDEAAADTVRRILAYKSGKAECRRVDVCIAGSFTCEAVSALADAGVMTVIFPAKSDATVILRRARKDGAKLPELGLGMRFTENFEAELDELLSRADEVNPRELVIRRAPELDGETFKKLAAAIRLALPHCGLTVDACESVALLDFATSVQTDGSDESADMLVNRLLKAGRLPGFCVGCALEGRCGKAFAEACENRSMHSFCYLNTLLSLKEFLSDFGSQDTRIIGTDRVLRELCTIKNDDVRSLVVKAMKDMRNGTRGLHF